MIVAAVLLGVLAGTILLGWLGLRVMPAPFPAFPQPQPEVERMPLPTGLPAPVERFYRQRYGEDIPKITTAVIRGRGTLKLSGLKVPMRFRFVHQAGQGFRSDIEMTFFGGTIMKALEIYSEGHGYGKTPGGVTEGEAWFDQSANIRMWAEAIEFFPAALLTTPGVRWEAMDETTALLVVPYGGARAGAAQDQLMVRFDPASHQAQFIEAMKYKDAETKTLWVNGIWMDDGKRWLEMNVEEVVYNLEVGESFEVRP
jgi:hypothetical protein